MCDSGYVLILYDQLEKSSLVRYHLMEERRSAETWLTAGDTYSDLCLEVLFFSSS
jgi:hypothetical protein